MPDATTPLHILVIDRSQELRTLFDDALSDEGYRVTALDSLPSDLNDIDKLVPDLVIVDDVWPKDDLPWSQLQLLRMHRPTTPIPLILCSGVPDQSSEVQQHLQAMGVQVVTKPFDLDDLYRTIHTLLHDVPSRV